MLKEVFLLLLLASVSVSESQSTYILAHANKSFTINYIPMKYEQSYSVVISTSCSSPRYTRDQISIAFGNACRQIYGQRLNDPSLGRFESCSSDTFKMNGPGLSEICYLYLYRSGSDGWKPESVKVSGYGKLHTFYYNTSIPKDTWYGFNLCNNAASSYKVITHKWMMSVLLGLVLSFWF